MMHNNLFLNRLVIYTEEMAIAYDEKYHRGVNIIRGDNSSGKSTITHFIFFVLGGAFSDFVPEAKRCSQVVAEVEINGAIFTIKRYLEKTDDDKISTQAPMFIFWGPFEESKNPPEDKTWQKFGYKTTDNKKSFSNVLFDLLKLPIVKGDSNITMHQILRLIYVDQESPTNSLFYYESFDSQLTRETVADLLLGVFNEDLYDAKRNSIRIEKEIEDIKSSINATKALFSDPLTLNPATVRAIIDDKENQIADIQNKIAKTRTSQESIQYQKEDKLHFQLLNDQAIQQRIKVVELENEINYLNSEIQDSIFFIDTLNKKIKALRDSIQTRESLGGIPLEYCPECLTKISDTTPPNKCKLCKEDIDNSYGVVQARRMEQEVGFQINESIKLLEINKKRLLELESKYEVELNKLQHIQRQVNAALENVKSYNEEVIDRLNNEKGFLEGELLQYRTLLEHAELYERLIKNKQELDREIGALKHFIYITEEAQRKLKVQINHAIKEEGVYLLNHDLDRQDEFKNANDFFIDFSNNMAFLSNRYSKYSASSNFYLKVSARFAIFLASLSVSKMRYPRFIFADNMEDKGIEEIRAQNLQKILIERLDAYDKETYQMIYTTSYITEELNDSHFVVGEYYTKEKPTLKNISK
ncbi:AAA family ATPase [Alistipes onderdonkii]|jgi:hypothetical protein|uniref:Rad50/SbcC-type AAA domain-containing protein n=1 Tax=Alistipes onderdonkii TaxID=328813 RepID=A0A1Y3QW19_9BACT|nr:AAA family ATPase [Alistipes onderdonkii]OUN03826.1 hypothetical protein B5G41_05005 [Alistipes onderdonkii]